jgi:hypothetical protein
LIHWAPRASARAPRRGLALCQRSHGLGELHEHLRVEAGADLALVDQFAFFHLAEQQGAEGTGAGRTFGPAHHDELLPQGAFDLDPIAGPITPIGRIGALGDDALLPGAAHGGQQLFAGADDMLRHMDR